MRPAPKIPVLGNEAREDRGEKKKSPFTVETKARKDPLRLKPKKPKGQPKEAIARGFSFKLQKGGYRRTSMPLGAVLTRVQFPGLLFPALTVARSGDPLVIADNAHFPLRDSTDSLIPWVDVADPYL